MCIKNVAKKQDLEIMNERLDAQGEEIKLIKMDLAQNKKELDELCNRIAQVEANCLYRGFETTDQNDGSGYRPRNVNNIAPTERDHSTLDRIW